MPAASPALARTHVVTQTSVDITAPPSVLRLCFIEQVVVPPVPQPLPQSQLHTHLAPKLAFTCQTPDPRHRVGSSVWAGFRRTKMLSTTCQLSRFDPAPCRVSTVLSISNVTHMSSKCEDGFLLRFPAPAWSWTDSGLAALGQHSQTGHAPGTDSDQGLGRHAPASSSFDRCPEFQLALFADILLACRLRAQSSRGGWSWRGCLPPCLAAAAHQRLQTWPLQRRCRGADTLASNVSAHF